jgi:hypothetical protein
MTREELALYQMTSSLGEIRKDPMVLYGIFLELTRQLFATEGFSDYVWDQDPAKTDIWIQPEYLWDDETVEKRPAVFISLPQLDYSSYTGRNDGQIAMDLKEAEHDFARRIKGAVQWIVIAEAKGEALKGGTDILNYVDAFASVIARDFCLEEFYVTQFKPVVVVKEARERIRTTLTAQFTAQETWTLKQESPKLKKLHIRTGQQILDLLVSGA